MSDANKTASAESATETKAAPLPAAAAPADSMFTKKNMLLVGGGFVAGVAIGAVVAKLWK